MYDILLCKFKGELKQKLVNTGEILLVEGNCWHDNFWGDCYCPKCFNRMGKNMLGRLLMKVRTC
jgi:predicted NAD-dependent protein-ADP-ribosyltransferase YbiA (DUF1768 family)